MTSSEESPLLLPTNNDDDANDVPTIRPSTKDKTSKRKETIVTWTIAAIVVMALISAAMGSTSENEQQVAKGNQLDMKYAYQSPQDATNAKFLREEELQRASIDSFIEAFARENAQSFYTHLYKGSREKLRELFYLNTTVAFEDLVTDHKSSALDFYQYVQGGWDAQINQGYCPIAAAAAVLNSLRGQIELPQDPVYMYVLSMYTFACLSS